MNMSDLFKSRIAIYAPMLIGGLVGLLMGKLGWDAVAGMAAGAAVWLAYEMRRNSVRMDQQMKQSQNDIDRLVKLNRQETMRPYQTPFNN